ncbi:MAG: HD domain-containing protein, partial [Arcobacteraceae bacterium]|nr:HD domain-containing protein [Arcobacteraceae bacterium]
NNRYDMIMAGFLHDIGKPFVAYQDDEDIITGEYSFTNHEEISYRIIQNWFFISDFTKNIVRYHYLIRGMANAKKKNQMGKYHRMKRIYDKLDDDFIEDLKLFMKFDDLAKR